MSDGLGRMLGHEMTSNNRVLMLGSAPDVVCARGWTRDGVDRIVAINNAWGVRPDWDHFIHPSDFPVERRPPAQGPAQATHGYEAYVPAVNAFGGFVYAGGTMAFTAGYWALHALRPRLIAFLGCDMVYAAAGASHFYGRGTPDPLRADPTLQSLEAKSARLQFLAAEAGCAMVNLSELPQSRLVAPRVDRAALARWTDRDGARVRAAVLTPEARAIAAEARSQEAALGYFVPDGRYWREIDRFDVRALRAIDALWLAAVRSYAVAA